jgi:hypothetical protein
MFVSAEEATHIRESHALLCMLAVVKATASDCMQYSTTSGRLEVSPTGPSGAVLTLSSSAGCWQLCLVPMGRGGGLLSLKVSPCSSWSSSSTAWRHDLLCMVCVCVGGGGAQQHITVSTHIGHKSITEEASCIAALMPTAPGCATTC